jgi:5-methylcytosine-specific restriction endonuclease McrA
MDDVEVDHAIPISSQGPDSLENLQIVHKLCNRKKGKKSE